MLFSQKIGIVGSSKCIKYPCVFPLRTRGSGGRSRAVVQGEAVQPNPCSSCWGGPAVPGPPLAPAKTTTSSDAIQEITQRRKEQTGTCGLSHMRGCWRLYSKYVGYSGKWWAGLCSTVASSCSGKSSRVPRAHAELSYKPLLGFPSLWIFLSPAPRVESSKNQKAAVAQARTKTPLTGFSYTINTVTGIKYTVTSVTLSRWKATNASVIT